MGRIGETTLRCWQTAHKMKVQRGPLNPDSSRNDNFRAKRYIAKYTINPAITHGFAHEIGSVAVGKSRPRLVEARILRGETKPGHAGRDDCNGTNGRSQCLHLNPAAGSLPANVWDHGPGHRFDRRYLRVAGGAQ